jgi:hypothetical protein
MCVVSVFSAFLRPPQELYHSILAPELTRQGRQKQEIYHDGNDGTRRKRIMHRGIYAMSQNFTEEYWRGRAAEGAVFAALFLGAIVYGVINLFASEGFFTIRQEYNQWMFNLLAFLLFIDAGMPGLTIWKYPRFTQGWVSRKTKFLGVSAPWDELGTGGKIFFYFSSTIILVFLWIMPLGLLVYTFFSSR